VKFRSPRYPMDKHMSCKWPRMSKLWATAKAYCKFEFISLPPSSLSYRESLAID